MMSFEDLVRKFRVDELRIFESQHWVWSLRPHQATLGAGILALKRPAKRYSELTSEEHSDVQNVVTRIESVLERTFQNDAINYLMLMMFDKHVHFHVLPRYQAPITRFGRVWYDDAWPGIPTLVGEPLVASELQIIRQHLMVELR